MKTYNTLSLSSPEEHVLLLSFSRPEAANSINTEMAIELEDFFQDVVRREYAHRCILLTGAGDKAFCAGGDLKERNGMTDAQWKHQHAIVERVILAMRDCPVPIISAVNGAAYGGGCEFAINTDFIYASERAVFALTETSLGIMPGAGGTQNLARIVGTNRAKEIIFTAKPFSAEQARQWGLVNNVYPHDKLMQAAIETAHRISTNAPLAIVQAKKSIQRGAEMDRRTALFFEVEAYNQLVNTKDRLEGVAAFNEKRLPNFKGE